MPGLDTRAEQQLADYAADVQQALGERFIGVVLYGSAAGIDWVAGKSDFNTVVVLRSATVAGLDALAPVVARWRRHGFALPVVLDEQQVEHARQLFPLELDDIKHQHRLLAGADPFVGLDTDEAALRRECAQEAFGKLLRLRAFYLEHRQQPQALSGMMVESVKSFLIAARQLLRMRGDAAPAGYDEGLAAAERVVGPLPTMRRVLAARPADSHGGLEQVAATYVDEVERLVGAVTAYCV
ncbi:MAG: hypothetical protein ABI629_09490 [bacterium]